MARWFVQHPGAAAVGPVDAAELRAAWHRQQIPPGTMACAEGFSQWVPFHTVAELVGAAMGVSPASPRVSPPQSIPRPERPPTRAGAVIAALLVVPFACVVVLALAFGGAGVAGPSLVALLGTVGAVAVGSSSLRLKTPAELVRTLAFAIPVGVVFLGGEGWGLGAGLSAYLKHANIHDALASSDPCVTPSVSNDDVTELADDVEKRRLEERSEACDAKNTAEGCTKLVAALDHGEKTLPTIKDQTTAAVAQRLATMTIEPADLAREKGSLACDDAVWTRLVKAAARMPAPWAGTGSVLVSDDMLAAVRAAAPTPEVLAAVGAHAEALASSTMNGTTASELEPAKKLCDVTAALGAPPAARCAALTKKYAAVARSEAAAADREQARGAAAGDARHKKDSALLLACTASCNRGRSSEQKQEDNERAAACLEKCGNDGMCLASCGGSSADACQARCLQKYPNGL